MKLTRGGAVDTSFAVPAYPQGFGKTPVTVTTTTPPVAFVNVSSTQVVPGLDGTTKPAAGTLFVANDDTTLYKSTGPAATPDQVTGLTVNAGATLALPTNWSGTWAYIQIPQGVLVNGTIKTATEGAHLDVESSGGVFQIGAFGTVTSAATTPGTSGGDLYLYGQVMINQGIVDSSAASTGGGSAGYAELDGQTHVYNTGTVKAKGGDNAADIGGDAGDIYIYAYEGSIYSSGTLLGTGGNGATGGGWGSYVDIEAANDGYMGRLVVGGTITADGGNATTGGNGGHGYGLYFYNYGSGDIWMNAAISAKGGNGAGAGSIGGNGAYMEVYWDYGSDFGYGEVGTAGTIKLGSAIDLAGGTGAADGGSGGDIGIYANTYNDITYPTSPTVELLGYASISLNGGNGTTGGSSDSFSIYTDYALTGDDYLPVPVGAIVNEVPVSAKGGDGALTGGNYGGSGGYIDFEAEGNFYIGTTVLTNSGAIDVSGGAGDNGGDSGGINFYGHDKLTNTATLTALGGKGVTVGGAGASGSVNLYATQDLANSGAIVATGGAATTTGGYSGYVGLYAGGKVTNSGYILANGGAATTTGGAGGVVDILSESAATANIASLNVSGGAATTKGVVGYIYMDYADVTPASGII